MKPTRWAIAPSIRGEAIGPDLRGMFSEHDQLDVDGLARVDAAAAEYGDFRERGQQWGAECIQEIVDGTTYARRAAETARGVRSSAAWVEVAMLLRMAYDVALTELQAREETT